MKLERIKCKPLERAKNLCISHSYIIGCTGQKAAIMDKQLNLVHTVEGLEYVYSAEVSPDETKLLLISTVNKFYIVDMRTFKKIRITVKTPYNYNLEGRGCWSFDGKSVFIPVNRCTDHLNSTLRQYHLDDLIKYEDYLADQYMVECVLRMDACKTYLLAGYNRRENSRNYFILFDGTVFQASPLENAAGIGILKATVDTEKGIVTIYSMRGCRQFTLEGKEIAIISHPSPKSQTRKMSDVFPYLADENTETQNLRNALFAAFGLTDVSIPDSFSIPDHINKYELSSNGDYIYLASKSGFYLLDASTGNILATVPEEYGAQNVEELAPGLVAIATLTGVKLYRLSNL